MSVFIFSFCVIDERQRIHTFSSFLFSKNYLVTYEDCKMNYTLLHFSCCRHFFPCIFLCEMKNLKRKRRRTFLSFVDPFPFSSFIINEGVETDLRELLCVSTVGSLKFLSRVFSQLLPKNPHFACLVIVSRVKIETSCA